MKSFLKYLLPLVLGFAIGFLVKPHRNRPGSTIIETTDTSSTVDAIDVQKPKLKDSTVVHHVWVKLPIVPAPQDSVPASQDSVPASQISYPDSAQVEIPIERKVYQEDSVYRAVVSGYHASLDSLLIYRTTTTVTITKTEKVEPKRWSLGITAGPGIVVSPSGSVHAGLGVAIGLTYRF